MQQLFELNYILRIIFSITHAPDFTLNLMFLLGKANFIS